ncbi:hypothetical protein B0H11DRAFT_1957498 [Mycena galericulata]|nr:hypothetical protein B0H11DRAFT_1957498 [Mycena galericulata]
MFILHVWPGQWGLPSIDPPCSVAVVFLQLAIPGQFTISYCTNPDLSPSGTLPYLTLGDGNIISPLSSIIKYISGLKDAVNLDVALNSFETSQRMAWWSHVGINLGDLVSYMFYSLPDNWAKLTHPALAYSLPVPQRYYVPGRMRDIRRPRLEAAGMWNQHPVESKTWPSKSGEDNKQKIAQTFQRDKVLQTARDCLDIYKRLLGENQFIFHERVTTLDIMLAAHILAIIKPPFPDTMLTDLLVDSYPTLVSHADRIISKSMEFPAPSSSPRGHSIRSLLPSWTSERVETSEGNNDRFEGWGWISLAMGSVSIYLITMGSPLRRTVDSGIERE